MFWMRLKDVLNWTETPFETSVLVHLLYMGTEATIVIFEW